MMGCLVWDRRVWSFAEPRSPSCGGSTSCKTAQCRFLYRWAYLWVMWCVFTYCRTSLCSRLYFPPFFKATLWIPSIARSIDCRTSSCSGVCRRQRTAEWQTYLLIKNVLKNKTNRTVAVGLVWPPAGTNWASYLTKTCILISDTHSLWPHVRAHI